MLLVTRLAPLALSLALLGTAHAQGAASAPVSAPAAPAPAATAGAESGKVAWYGARFAGRRTASGQAFNPGAMTMAHKTLPFGTQVRVTNLKNKRSVVLRVNDRGPQQADRVADVSQAAARKLGMLRSGVVDASIEVVADAKARRAKA